MSALIAAKRALKPGPKSSGLIKGEAFAEYFDGSAPGFSASGQDVWLPMALAHGRGRGVVLSAVGARCGKVFLADDPIWGTVANTVAWNIAEGWDQKFVHYLINRESFWIKGGAAQPYVQVEASLSQTVQLIPLDEQRQIAEYLDRETGEIDELIAKQERLVKVLGERRVAAILYSVTKGLDDQVALKPSGVPWAGSIPTHWGVPRVAHGFAILLGKMVNEGRAVADEAIDAPYLRAGNVQPYGLDVSEVKQMPFTMAELSNMAMNLGDLIVVEGGQGGYGRSAIVHSSLDGWAFQNHVMRVRPTGFQRNRFLDYVLKSMRSTGFIASLSSHASLPSFSADKLKSTRYPRPPIEEQDKIVDYLDALTTSIDRLIAKSAETVDLLRERRAALISAAVTGKIDVRGL